MYTRGHKVNTVSMYTRDIVIKLLTFKRSVALSCCPIISESVIEFSGGDPPRVIHQYVTGVTGMWSYYLRGLREELSRGQLSSVDCARSPERAVRSYRSPAKCSDKRMCSPDVVP